MPDDLRDIVTFSDDSSDFVRRHDGSPRGHYEYGPRPQLLAEALLAEALLAEALLAEAPLAAGAAR